MAEAEKKAEKPKETKPAAPEMVSLKDIAKRLEMEPREARAILRKLGTREEGEKRSRWQFPPDQVNAVISKVKAAKVKMETAKAEKAKEEEEEED